MKGEFGVVKGLAKAFFGEEAGISEDGLVPFRGWKNGPDSDHKEELNYMIVLRIYGE